MVMTGEAGGVIRMESGLLPVRPLASVTVNVGVKVPLTVGVPVSAPAAERAIPVGRLPGGALQVKGGVPLVAASEAVYGWFWIPDGKAVRRNDRRRRGIDHDLDQPAPRYAVVVRNGEIRGEGPFHRRRSGQRPGRGEGDPGGKSCRAPRVGRRAARRRKGCRVRLGPDSRRKGRRRDGG